MELPLGLAASFELDVRLEVGVLDIMSKAVAHVAQVVSELLSEVDRLISDLSGKEKEAFLSAKYGPLICLSAISLIRLAATLIPRTPSESSGSSFRC